MQKKFYMFSNKSRMSRLVAQVTSWFKDQIYTVRI